VYVGASGVLTGSARMAQEAQEQAGKVTLQQETERKQLELNYKRKALEAQIAAMRAEYEAQEPKALSLIGQEKGRGAQLVQDRVDMGLSRKADSKPNKHKGGSK
jgi:circadian clock protein KaiC